MRSDALVIFGAVFLISEMTCWTIDLPEVRRIYFEKYSKNEGVENKKSDDNNFNGTFFDNINGDSLHNKEKQYYDVIINYDEMKSDIYADGYKNYESYMVRKVHTALDKGSEYLDGLRVSIERYMEMIENCTRTNFTLELPSNMISVGNSSRRGWEQRCREATESSEHVRRLVDLALWTTNRLQDVAYTAKYSKDASMEENELLLRLAWYLEKLAQLTGFDPDVDRVTTTERPQEPTVPNRSGMNMTQEMMTNILNCLRQNSSVPATERCGVPDTPALAAQLANYFGISDFPSSNFTTITNGTGRVTRGSSDGGAGAALEPELLVATDNSRVLPRFLTAVKSVKKRSVTDENDPLVKFLKYYAKHKSWVESNNKNVQTVEKPEDFDVQNDLYHKSVQKRSIKEEKDRKIKIDLEEKKKFAFIKPAAQHHVINNIKEVLDIIHTKKVLTKKKLEHLRKIFRVKRSYHPHTHYGEVMKPRIPVDPQGDISYYVKNKEGVTRNYDLAQAALVRASLEKIFQTGNIEVVHRYGSNYNPLNPYPLYAGILKSLTDI